MTPLHAFILKHTQRGACACGRCADAVQDPKAHQPNGHTADMIFFKVAAKDNPDAAELKTLVAAHEGEYGPVDLFDGKDHSYLEVGGFVGDQGLALQLMGLGTVLGLWRLLTPRTVFHIEDDKLAMQMAGAGYVSVQATP